MKNLSHNFNLPEVKPVTILRSVSITLADVPSEFTDEQLLRIGEKLAAQLRCRMEMEACFRCYGALDPELFDFVKHRRPRR